MATQDRSIRKKNTTDSKERQFKGLSLTERKQARREKLIGRHCHVWHTGILLRDG